MPGRSADELDEELTRRVDEQARIADAWSSWNATRVTGCSRPPP